MKSLRTLAFGLLLAAGAAVAQSGGGCLAGRYTYYDDAGGAVGGATVGCPASQSYAWGEQTDNAVFSAGCLSES